MKRRIFWIAMVPWHGMAHACVHVPRPSRTCAFPSWYPVCKWYWYMVYGYRARAWLSEGLEETRTVAVHQDALVTGCPSVRIVVRLLMSSDIDLIGRLLWASTSSWPLNFQVYSTSFVPLLHGLTERATTAVRKIWRPSIRGCRYLITYSIYPISARLHFFTLFNQSASCYSFFIVYCYK